MRQTLSICFSAQTLRNICGDQNPVRRPQPKKVPPGLGGDQKALVTSSPDGEPSAARTDSDRPGRRGGQPGRHGRAGVSRWFQPALA